MQCGVETTTVTVTKIKGDGIRVAFESYNLIGAGETAVIQCGTENVILTVTDIKGKGVGLGFEASDLVRIDREEVFEENQRGKEKA